MNYIKSINEKLLTIESKSLLESEMSHFKGNKPKLYLTSNISGSYLELLFNTDNSEFKNYFIRININTTNSLYTSIEVMITIELSTSTIYNIENNKELNLYSLDELINYYNTENKMNIHSNYFIVNSVIPSTKFLTIKSKRKYNNTSIIKEHTIKEILYHTKEIVNTYLKQNIIQ